MPSVRVVWTVADGARLLNVTLGLVDRGRHPVISNKRSRRTRSDRKTSLPSRNHCCTEIALAAVSRLATQTVENIPKFDEWDLLRGCFVGKFMCEFSFLPLPLSSLLTHWSSGGNSSPLPSMEKVRGDALSGRALPKSAVGRGNGDPTSEVEASRFRLGYPTVIFPQKPIFATLLISCLRTRSCHDFHPTHTPLMYHSLVRVKKVVDNTYFQS